MKQVADKYSERLSTLEANGFIQQKGCITNGKYAFMYTDIDISALTDKQFKDFVKLIKSEKNAN
jgi:hypothetical protein